MTKAMSKWMSNHQKFYPGTILDASMTFYWVVKQKVE